MLHPQGSQYTGPIYYPSHPPTSSTTYPPQQNSQPFTTPQWGQPTTLPYSQQRTPSGPPPTPQYSVPPYPPQQPFSTRSGHPTTPLSSVSSHPPQAQQGSQPFTTPWGQPTTLPYVVPTHPPQQNPQSFTNPWYSAPAQPPQQNSQPFTTPWGQSTTLPSSVSARPPQQDSQSFTTPWGHPTTLPYAVPAHPPQQNSQPSTTPWYSVPAHPPQQNSQSFTTPWGHPTTSPYSVSIHPPQQNSPFTSPWQGPPTTLPPQHISQQSRSNRSSRHVRFARSNTQLSDHSSPEQFEYPSHPLASTMAFPWGSPPHRRSAGTPHPQTPTRPDPYSPPALSVSSTDPLPQEIRILPSNPTLPTTPIPQHHSRADRSRRAGPKQFSSRPLASAMAQPVASNGPLVLTTPPPQQPADLEQLYVPSTPLPQQNSERSNDSTTPPPQPYSLVSQHSGPSEISSVEQPPFLQPRSSVQILRHELYAAQRRLLQNSNLISSLCAELDMIRNIVCHNCKTKTSPANLARQVPQISIVASAESHNIGSRHQQQTAPGVSPQWPHTMPRDPSSSPDNFNSLTQQANVQQTAFRPRLVTPSHSPTIVVSTPPESTEGELVEEVPLFFQPLAPQTPIVTDNGGSQETPVAVSPHPRAGAPVTLPFSSPDSHNTPSRQTRPAHRPDSPLSAILSHFPSNFNTSTTPETTETFSTPSATPVVEKRTILARPTTESPKWPVKYNSKIEKELSVTFLHAFKHTSAVYDVRFSPDGNFLAAGLYYDLGRAQIYDLSTKSIKCSLAEHSVAHRKSSDSCGILSLCFSRNGRYLVVGGTFKTVYIWDLARKSVLAAFKGHTDSVWSLDVSPNGRLLVTGSRDGSVRVWNMHDGSSRFLATEGSDVASVRFSPSGRYVASSNTNGFLRMWDVRSGKLVGRWEGHRGVIQSLAFSPDGEELVSSSWDGTTKSWDVSSLKAQTQAAGERGGRDHMLVPKNKMQFDGHSGPGVARSLSISPDGKWIITGSSDQRVCIWNMHTGVQQCTLEGHVNEVLAVDFSPVRNYIAIGSLDGFVTLWRYERV